jgi:Tfp pilus assembly protein PilO
MTRILAVTLVVVALSVLLWWVAVVEPARQQVAALESETAALEADRAQLANQRASLLALRERAPILEEELQRLAAAIPADPDQERLLAVVQDAAAAAGVTFTSLAFTDPEPVDDAPAPGDPRLVLGATTVSGGMRATYFQIVDFLRRLEVGSPRVILVTAIAVTEAEAGFPQLDATFSADIFSLIPVPVDPLATEPTAPVPPGTATPTATPAPTPLPAPAPAAAPTAGPGAVQPVPAPAPAPAVGPTQVSAAPPAPSA